MEKRSGGRQAAAPLCLGLLAGCGQAVCPRTDTAAGPEAPAGVNAEAAAGTAVDALPEVFPQSFTFLSGVGPGRRS